MQASFYPKIKYYAAAARFAEKNLEASEAFRRLHYWIWELARPWG
jgi:hypothetical protein